MNNFMFAGSARVVTAPGLNAEPSRNKWELLRSHITRLLRGVASSACVFLPLIVGASGSRDYDSTLVRAKGKEQVTIVYQDDAVQPENRDAIKSIRDPGVFERMADRLTKAVALPHDLQVVVTDNVPKGIDDPTTEVDGRRIVWPNWQRRQTFAKEECFVFRSRFGARVCLCLFAARADRNSGGGTTASEGDLHAETLFTDLNG